MLSNYYTLATLATDLDARLRGKIIREAYTQEKNALVLSFEGMSETLIVSCAPEVNTLYLHPNFSRARTNSTDVLKTMRGTSILSVSIQPMDRVIAFRLQDELTVYALFFGSRANVLLVDKESHVVDAFKDARSTAGSMYMPRHGEIVHDVAALSDLITQEPAQTLFTLLKRTSPVLGSTLVNEILFRSEVQATSRAQDISNEQCNRLKYFFTTMLTELGQPKPRVYVGKELPHAPYRFSLVRLEHCRKFDERFFTDIHEGIRFFVSRMRSTGALQSHASEILATLRQHQTKLQRTAAAVEEDLENTSRADEYDKYATLLMGNLSEVEKGVKSVTIPGEGRIVVVPLDAKLSPIQNAQRYFEKAKKSRLAYHQSRKRLVEVHATLRTADDLLISAEAIHSKEDLKEFLAERAEELDKFGIGKKAEEREQLPFRIFTVEGGFEVWAGKSSRNNDELTMKHAKPNDLWFHARGASGSHVILKINTGNGEPGKKAREQAAGIAAYYSKMKNARMVPVTMTERKYVRKPKASPPGTVVLEREKVIFAEPALPEG
jgi:predicted ribosome quality control (RQC) complex YloA/Tae2 family protein